ncbi:hypothetical protein PO81_06540, partial [Vibrio parahaemolyticus]
KVDFILEGGSIDFNGEGVMLTSSHCLLNENRNSHLNKTQIDTKLKEIFGLKHIIWLENGYIKGRFRKMRPQLAYDDVYDINH